MFSNLKAIDVKRVGQGREISIEVRIREIEQFKEDMLGSLESVKLRYMSTYLNKITEHITLEKLAQDIHMIESEEDKIEYFERNRELISNLYKMVCGNCIAGTCKYEKKYDNCLKCPKYRGLKPCGHADQCARCEFHAIEMAKVYGMI